jgi:hypothetical protein
MPMAIRITPNVGRAASVKAADCSWDRVIVPFADKEDTDSTV